MNLFPVFELMDFFDRFILDVLPFEEIPDNVSTNYLLIDRTFCLHGNLVTVHTKDRFERIVFLFVCTAVEIDCLNHGILLIVVSFV